MSKPKANPKPTPGKRAQALARLMQEGKTSVTWNQLSMMLGDMFGKGRKRS